MGLLYLLQALRIGHKFQAPAVGIQHHLTTVFQVQDFLAQGHQARQALAPGQDRHMGGRAAGSHAQAGYALGAQLQQVRGVSSSAATSAPGGRS